MRRLLVLIPVVLAGLTGTLAGCGDGGGGSAVRVVPASAPRVTSSIAPMAASKGAASSGATSVVMKPDVASVPLLPFATPEAAMRYLAQAYNGNDGAGLRKVTTPSARLALEGMRSEAVNLRLDRCARQPAGDYVCTFTHDYPVTPGQKKPNGHGSATFTVGPATAPGWYMTVLESCG